MDKLKIFCIAFFLTFVSIAILCVLTSNPLIFLPVSYSYSAFIEFGFLTGALSFGLAFIALPILRFSYQKLKLRIRETFFYLTGIFLILQILTLVFGYIESSYSVSNGDFLYYYKGVGNSLIYIAIWNLTSLVCSYLFSNKQNEIETPEILDSGKNFR